MKVLKSVFSHAFDAIGIHQQELQRCQAMENLGWQTGNLIHVEDAEKRDKPIIIEM